MERLRSVRAPGEQVDGLAEQVSRGDGEGNRGTLGVRGDGARERRFSVASHAKLVGSAIRSQLRVTS